MGAESEINIPTTAGLANTFGHGSEGGQWLQATWKRLHTLTNSLVDELISITPETMAEIQFEIVATEDGGADIGLLVNHPDATRVALSETVYDCCSRYVPLVKQYARGWKRSLITLHEVAGSWHVSVNFEQG